MAASADNSLLCFAFSRALAHFVPDLRDPLFINLPLSPCRLSRRNDADFLRFLIHRVSNVLFFVDKSAPGRSVDGFVFVVPHMLNVAFEVGFPAVRHAFAGILLSSDGLAAVDARILGLSLFQHRRTPLFRCEHHTSKFDVPSASHHPALCPPSLTSPPPFCHSYPSHQCG